MTPWIRPRITTHQEHSDADGCRDHPDGLADLRGLTFGLEFVVVVILLILLFYRRVYASRNGLRRKTDTVRAAEDRDGRISHGASVVHSSIRAS